jgi:hypothetical protein
MPAAATKAIRAEVANYFDTKAQILAKIGDVSGFEIASNEVLIAIYQRPDKTPGGIIQTPRILEEDKYQGKVGLVLKYGDACRFVVTDKESGITYGIPIAVGDWVVVRPSDTWALDVNANPTLDRNDFVPCRLVAPHHIRAKVSNPASVW